MPIVKNGVPGKADGAADGTPDDTVEVTSGLALGTLGEYAIALLSAPAFYAGEIRALRFSIADESGVTPAPTSASITLYPPAGSPIAGDDCLLDPSPPAGTQIVGSAFQMPAVTAPTAYLARIVATMPDEQERIGEQVIIVQP
jgi:hypothetical protein